MIKKIHMILSAADRCHQTRLHNVMQKHFGCHEYNLFNSEETVDGMQPLFWSGVMIHDHEPIGVWRAKSGRYSNIKAAILAVEVLEGVAPYEFRAKYGCDCREDTEGGDEGSSTA